jgi:anti-sigma regulatory factor (Ser/Thr protein kinase)/uncharacterized protein YoxC
VLVAQRMSKRLVDPMADLTIRLTSNATSIASNARQQAANVANINTSGNEIATAVNQISATSKELLRAMEMLADDAEKTSTVANEGSRGLKGLGSSMESLSTATHSITDKLTTIRAKANKINSVVTAITKVADQTNLLSLNAAIEAEKAGEGGAGFAVVAREIRRLADQSALATMEIEQMVEAMQEAVSSGVEQTRELTEAMDHGIAASESISGQFGDIIARVESMVPRYEAVHEGMQNQSEGAQQISEAMWQLTEMGRQTSESGNDLNDVSHQLHEAVRSELVRLASFIEDFAVAHGMAFADSHAFMLAAEELFANTLSHSRSPVTLIEFSIVADSSSAVATYADDGSPFDPTAMAEVDTTLPLELRTVGGLGIHFIRRTMPAFHYERREGRNIITFGRVLSSLSRSEDHL